jgi:hypothetical protein
MFISTVGCTDSKLADFVILGSRTLLDRVCQLMCEQMQPSPLARLILTASEDNVRTNCVSRSIDGAHRLCGLRTCVDSDPTEIVTEARLHHSACAVVQRLTGRSQHFMHDRRRKRRP